MGLIKCFSDKVELVFLHKKYFQYIPIYDVTSLIY